MEDSGAYEINASIEYRLQNEYKQVGNDDRVYEVEINGDTYCGKYVETLISPYYKCDADIYIATVDNDLFVEFWINRYSDKLVDYSFAYRDGYAIQSNDHSYDDCFQIAIDELGNRLNRDEFIPILQDEHKKSVYVPECGNVYSFYFKKMINNTETNIIVWIDVNTDGLVCLYNAVEEPSFESFSGEYSIIETMNSADTIEMIYKKIVSIYSVYDPKEVDWNINKQYISKLRSGKVCAQYEISVSINGYEGKDYLRLLVEP